VIRGAARLMLAGLILGAAVPASGAGRPGVHQDAPRLTWLVPAFLPPDGLLTVGAGFGRTLITYAPDGNPGKYTLYTGRAFADWTPLPGVALSVEQQYRSYTDYFFSTNAPAASAGGLGHGLARAAVAVPGLPDWLGAVAWGSASLPLGDAALSEDAASPAAGATVGVALWRGSVLPEMRLHATWGRRWNASEETGYGVDPALRPQPWYPQYPAAAAVGGEQDNDFTLWGVALEFRKNSTALWLEYSEQELRGARGVVTPEEDHRILAAGLRWGLEEGWALHADYQVGFHLDDLATAWYPEGPQLVYGIGVSRQFGLGGRDGDGDGIPDRRDACPTEPEDLDGFQDEDGCPDLDNDQDGIPDHLDGAPLDPEDMDGWLDHDGVPDLDNDGDGIPDWRDACPDEAEDFDGYKDEDGCPEEFRDRDGDGIADEDDLCPGSPEDFDGHQDGDGCPDPDNDLDGIDDVDDECPDLPEDYDGDRDRDGCPDPMPDAGDAGDEGDDAGDAAAADEESGARSR